MKKGLLFMAVALWGFACGWAETVTFDFANHGAEMFGFSEPSSSSSSAGDINAECTATVGGVTLKVGTSSTNTKNRVYLDYNGFIQLRIYSGEVSIAAPEGKVVTSAVFHNSRWYSPTPSTGSFVQENTWAGSTSAVSFDFGGQCRLDSLVVTYADGGVVDPSVKEIDTFLSLGDSIADGTKFRFTGMAFVAFKLGNYHFLRCADEYYYSALAMGEMGQDYEVGAYLPAGWTGVKNTVDGLTVITDIADTQPATIFEEPDECDPFDYSGYLGFFSDGVSTYENDYCAFGPVTLSTIDAEGNFTITETDEDETATMPGLNKFGIEYPAATEGENFTIEGILAKGKNGAGTLFVPTAVKEYNNVERLWRIWYEGKDGTEYTVADSLYVVAPTKALEPECESKNLIYVTDNATLVVDDTYAEWGWVETYDWTPDFIALDCGDNAELYDAVAAMKVIAPATVKGVLADNYTNPRLILKKAPSALECEFPDIAYLRYTFGDTCWANGNQVMYATGRFVTIDGEEYLAGIDANGKAVQPIALDRRYIGNYAFEEGQAYDMRVVMKMHEPWEFDTDAALSPAAKKQTKKRAARKSPRRKIAFDDPNYYTNYFA
ncbi:MAG: hypothetical protein Q4B68_05045, partial [Bacteroidales bacterium]|nr:hypothetical protein [Bacteroidales bacterium]